jgi:hypothetical protein
VKAQGGEVSTPRYYVRRVPKELGKSQTWSGFDSPDHACTVAQLKANLETEDNVTYLATQETYPEGQAIGHQTTLGKFTRKVDPKDRDKYVAMLDYVDKLGGVHATLAGVLRRLENSCPDHLTTSTDPTLGVMQAMDDLMTVINEIDVTTGYLKSDDHEYWMTRSSHGPTWVRMTMLPEEN